MNTKKQQKITVKGIEFDAFRSEAGNGVSEGNKN